MMYELVVVESLVEEDGGFPVVDLPGLGAIDAYSFESHMSYLHDSTLSFSRYLSKTSIKDFNRPVERKI